MLTVGTRRDDDDPLRYDLSLGFAPGGASEPEMSILLPPHSVDALIQVLEDCANQARYIMGQEMVEYPPVPCTRKRRRRKAGDRVSDE
jgi:hypothetical protein